MSISNRVGAFFFKHHQPEAKRVEKRVAKQPLMNARLMRIENGPVISHVPSVAASQPRPTPPQRFEELPADLPSVDAPPPGTRAIEEPDTTDLAWGDAAAGGTTPNWCRVLCCRAPVE